MESGLEKKQEFNEDRKLAAIMFTDMVGYSALTQENEALALELLQEHREILRPIFISFNGKEIETAGDSFFVEFSSALEAAKCSIEIQKTLYQRNQTVPAASKIILRIGLHIGDVVHIGKHVHGDGVNLAARLEPLAAPGGICLSEDVARQIQNKIPLPLINIGKKKLKNIKQPVEVYSICLPWELHKRATYNFSVSRTKIIIAAAIIVLAAAAAFFFLPDILNNSSATDLERRIAVLPLANYSDDEQDEYFADGMTEEIISSLSKIADLSVIARTSVMKYKNTNLNVAEIGRELNVGTILEGSVRKAMDKARITIQLIEVKSQKHLWSNDYDRELKDIFAIQSDIAMKVADELKIHLLADEKEQITKKGTANTEAYRFYLLGRFHFYRRTGEALNRGAEYFKQSIKIDSNFALAYAGLADCYTLIAGAGYGSREDSKKLIPLAKSAAMKAVQLDESLAEAHTSLAYTKFRLEWDWDGAEKEFKRAIELSPGYSTAREWYALFLATRGRPGEALPQAFKASELDPLSLSVGTLIGRLYDYTKQDQKAINQFKKTILMDSTYAEARFGLGMTYWSLKMYKEAVKEVEKALALSKGRIVIRTFQAMLYSSMGNKEYADKLLKELKSYPNQEGLSYYYAMIYYGLDDADKLFEYLNKAYEERHGLLVYINSDSEFFSKYNSDPRFKELLRKMGFDG